MNSHHSLYYNKTDLEKDLRPLVCYSNDNFNISQKFWNFLSHLIVVLLQKNKHSCYTFCLSCFSYVYEKLSLVLSCFVAFASAHLFEPHNFGFIATATSFRPKHREDCFSFSFSFLTNLDNLILPCFHSFLNLLGLCVTCDLKVVWSLNLIKINVN